jgi:hypothetical protein
MGCALASMFAGRSMLRPYENNSTAKPQIAYRESLANRH